VSTPVVEFQAATRRFGDLVAVDAATLDIRSGEVLAVLGENGAGKSTLMKMLYGIHPPSEGRILIDGEQSAVQGPADAMRNGIGMVFQHFSQFPALSVRDNLLLAWPKTPYLTGRKRAGIAPALATLAELAPHVDPDAKVADLSVGEQQLLELSKVLNISARIVIFDEPTSVLTPAEAKNLHGFIRRLADEGMAVVLITHKLADVTACADRIAVMRRGAIVDVSKSGEKPISSIVSLMMGKEVKRRLVAPKAREQRVDQLFLNHVCAHTPGMELKDVSLRVARGEVLGIAGVAGNGQSLLADVIAGIHPLDSGDIVLDGLSIARRDARQTLTTRIGYIPEQPRDNAIVEDMTVLRNLDLRVLAAGRKSDGSSVELLSRFNVNPPDLDRRAGSLSGGNLQKLVSARELGMPRSGVLACYPTMGLDLAAIELVYRELFAQAEAGAAVIWISEDLDDLMLAAHRIAVLREGAVVAVKDNDGTLSRDQIGALMTGMHADEVAI
jgi:simple sugar transport system ATP-binding protein